MSQALIEDFYAAFGRADGAAMAACYAPGARFDDPVFKKLRGEEPGAMWRMLTAEARELEVELLDYADHGEWGTARWRARYVFPEPQIDAIMEGREPPPPMGWTRNNKGEARPLPPIGGPAAQT